MTREEKCVYLIDKGYTYNPETGEFKNPQGKVLKSYNNHGYMIVKFMINKKTYSLLQHHFSWYYMYGEIVKCLDHINQYRNDNRICNLRSITTQQNSFNSKSKGYSLCKKTNKWSSAIRINGKAIHLGYHKTEDEARQSYLDGKKKYHII
jgi:hypothetical protein